MRPGDYERPSNMEINDGKIGMVLKWISHFQFSSIELLSSLILSKRNGSTRFFRQLIERNYIVRFQSENFGRKDLVRLGPEGVEYLRERIGIVITRNPRSDELSRKVKLRHDYKVQVHILNNHFPGTIPHILTDAKIIRDRRTKTRIPDALIFESKDTPEKWNVSTPVNIPVEVERQRRGLFIGDEDAFWINPDAPIAIEVETNSKSTKARKEIFRSLAIQIYLGKLKRVEFVFIDKKILDLYVDVFSETRWDSSFSFDEDHPIRSCFRFEMLNENLSYLAEVRAEDKEIYDAIKHG